MQFLVNAASKELWAPAMAHTAFFKIMRLAIAEEYTTSLNFVQDFKNHCNFTMISCDFSDFTVNFTILAISVIFVRLLTEFGLLELCPEKCRHYGDDSWDEFNWGVWTAWGFYGRSLTMWLTHMQHWIKKHCTHAFSPVFRISHKSSCIFHCMWQLNFNANLLSNPFWSSYTCIVMETTDWFEYKNLQN